MKYSILLNRVYSSHLFWFRFLNMLFLIYQSMHSALTVQCWYLPGWNILSGTWAKLYGMRSGIYNINVATYQIQVDQVSLYYYILESDSILSVYFNFYFHKTWRTTIKLLDRRYNHEGRMVFPFMTFFCYSDS
jgi:hypothetical protein